MDEVKHFRTDQSSILPLHKSIPLKKQWKRWNSQMCLRLLPISSIPHHHPSLHHCFQPPVSTSPGCLISWLREEGSAWKYPLLGCKSEHQFSISSSTRAFVEFNESSLALGKGRTPLSLQPVCQCLPVTSNIPLDLSSSPMSSRNRLI